MIITADSNSFFPNMTSTPKVARGLVRKVQEDGISFEAEKTDEEVRLESSKFSYQKELTPEEEKRVIFLKNLMSQILSLSAGEPTEEQKARIKEIEKELEKITGIKMQSSISTVTAKMPGGSDTKKGRKKKDAEEKEERQMNGIDPKEAIHTKMPKLTPREKGGIMQILQRNRISSYTPGSLTLGENCSFKA